MKHDITLDLSSLGLDQAALRTVYGGIVRLASNEAYLLTEIVFDGRQLTLCGVGDDSDQVLAKLGDYLDNLPLQKQLESLLALEPVLM